jgi:hypothetical protein
VIPRCSIRRGSSLKVGAIPATIAHERLFGENFAAARNAEFEDKGNQ